MIKKMMFVMVSGLVLMFTSCMLNLLCNCCCGGGWGWRFRM